MTRLLLNQIDDSYDIDDGEDGGRRPHRRDPSGQARPPISRERGWPEPDGSERRARRARPAKREIFEK